MRFLLRLLGFGATPGTSRRYRRDMTTSDLLVIDTPSGPMSVRLEKLTTTKAVLNVLYPPGVTIKST